MHQQFAKSFISSPLSRAYRSLVDFDACLTWSGQITLLLLCFSCSAPSVAESTPSSPSASAERTTLASEPQPNTIPEPAKNTRIYDTEVVDIDGKPVSLKRYEGKVVLIVNTASECGYTPQYGELERLYRSYKGRPFEILAFPSNDFGGQEPNDEEFIKSFTSENFDVTFPLFAKIQTRGPQKSALYRALTEEGPQAFRGEVGWNFTKFLVGPQGDIVARYGSSTSPTAGEVKSAIDAALALIPSETAPASPVKP